MSSTNPVVLAHEHATMAEQAYRNGEYPQALQLHKAAMVAFLKAKETFGQLDSTNAQAMLLLSEAQRTRALSILRRIKPGITDDQAMAELEVEASLPPSNHLPPAQAMHSQVTRLPPPSAHFSSTPGGVVADGSRPNTLDTSGALSSYEPPAMRTHSRNPAWSEWPFLPAPVQNVFDKLTDLMESLLPNVATVKPGEPVPAATPVRPPGPPQSAGQMSMAMHQAGFGGE
jgi:hypothetical protein